MRRAGLWPLLALIVLAGCVEEPEAGPAGRKLNATERAECLAAGGRPGRGGLVPDEVCFRPTRDAGKACTKAGECEGVCEAETRTCAAETPRFGCFEMLDETGRAVGLCVD